MPQYIFFARHGETEANRLHYLQSQTLDEPLNKTGINQAKKLGNRLRNEDIGLILTSTAKRAIDTSTIIATTIALYPDSPSVIAEADFLEINCGSLDKMYYQEIKQKYPDLFNAWWGTAQSRKHKFPFPRGESFNQIVSRSKRVVERIKRACEVHHGNILIVSHGSITSVIIALLFGVNTEIFFNAIYFENCGLIKIDMNHSNNGRPRWVID